MVSPLSRSEIMSRVKARDTKPELITRRLVHELGFRFRLHRRDLPGTPDLVFPRLRLALFVHGCFWHRHLNCKLTTTPKTNADFWSEKFSQNMKRDDVAARRLRAAGWSVQIVWGCETRNPERLRKRLAKLLKRLNNSAN